MLLSNVSRMLLSLAAVVFCAGASAQQSSWPNKTVRLVVPAAAGGPVDLVARVLAEKLTSTLGQTFIVDNRAGAGHLIGTEAAARSAPDGYTFLVVTTPHVINPALRTKMPYDTEMMLRKKLPLKHWIDYNALLVTWGQNICKPISPLCSRCGIRTFCPRKGVGKSR